jgi:flagellar hook assembly protein FlgD
VLITLDLPYAARFRFEIKSGTGYDLRTYDQMGTAGLNIIRWDMKSKKGKTVEPGLYILRIVVFLDEGQFKATGVMILE